MEYVGSSVFILDRELSEVVVLLSSRIGVGGVGGGLPPKGGDRIPFGCRVISRSRLVPLRSLVLPASPNSSTTGKEVPVRSSL